MEDHQLILNLGNEFYMKGDYESAKNHYEMILPLYEDSIVLNHNMGMTLTKLGLLEDAIERFSVSAKLGFEQSYLSRGAAYRSLGQYKEAMRDFANAFVLNPNLAAAYSNYGTSLREFGYSELAVPFLQIATKLEPTNMHFRLNESVAHLTNRDFEKGFELYDARWYYDSEKSFKPELPGVEYSGQEDINGKRVFVYGEQGYGDNIQFSRYLLLLEKLGANVLFYVREPLRKLFRENFPNITVLDDVSTYDYHVPLLDLPKIFKTKYDTVPFPNAYIKANNSIKKRFETLLGPKTKLRVGISFSSTKDSWTSRFRTIELNKFLQLKMPHIELVNLTKELSAEDEKFCKTHDIKNFNKFINDFNDTAGLIGCLDFVVTVDTVISHLAGSMGVKTYVLLSNYGCDWRWFKDTDSSVFYNSVKLFRQNEENNWNTVLQQVQQEIAKI